MLQPFLMGRAVSLHPLAVICAVAVGSLLLGIVGALFSVPFLAVLNTVVRYFHGIDQFPELGTQPMPGAEEDADHDPKGCTRSPPTSGPVTASPSRQRRPVDTSPRSRRRAGTN